MTYYDILGVPHNASFEQIKKAYREQIRFFHPDVFTGSEDVAKLKTQQLNEAYEVLIDPVKRAEYDSKIGKDQKQEEPASTKHSSNQAEEQRKKSQTKDEPSYTPNPPKKEKKTRQPRQWYCKFCGNIIDSKTKKCTGCGKQYFKAKTIPLYIFVGFLLLLVLVTSYIGYNYFSAMSAMNNQEFIKAKHHFDNLLISEEVFPTEYEYVEAGVLMEEGKYTKAFSAFIKAKGYVPSYILEPFIDKIYSAGQNAYRNGDLDEAEACFIPITPYKRSRDYLSLINCQESPSKFAVYTLVGLLDFENTKEIIMKSHSTAVAFLANRWESGNYYFEIKDGEDNSSSYNLPYKDVDGYYNIRDGIYSVGEDIFKRKKLFRFSIIDADTISVYCYKDGSTYTLYRQ